jgi:uridine kinase
MRLFFFLTLFSIHLFSKPYLIGICGASGSGKTTLANEILELIPKKVCIIRQDSYYNDLSHLKPEERRQQNFDIPDAIDFKTLEDNLASIRKEQVIFEPNYDFKTNSRTSKTSALESRPVVIVEGTLIFTSTKIREQLDLMIFVDTPLDLCLCRRASRDISERGISFDEAQKQYQDQVRPMYFKHILNCKNFAHIVIPNHNIDKGWRKKIQKDLLAQFS